MKRIFTLLSLLVIITTSLFAYKLTINEDKRSFTLVLKNGNEVVIDNTTYSRRFNEVRVEQYSDGIYGIIEDDEMLIVNFSSNQSDVEYGIKLASYSKNDIFGIISWTNDELQFNKFFNKDLEYLVSNKLSSNDIQKARRYDIKCATLTDTTSIYVDEDDISVFDNSKPEGLKKIICPSCGTVFYI